MNSKNVSQDYKMFENLEQLMQIIREKKKIFPDKSYTNKLLSDKSLSVAKVKEEIGELIELLNKTLIKYTKQQM